MLLTALIACGDDAATGPPPVTVEYGGAGLLRVTSDPAGIDCGAQAGVCTAMFETANTSGTFCFSIVCKRIMPDNKPCTDMLVDRPVTINCVSAVQ